MDVCHQSNHQPRFDDSDLNRRVELRTYCALEEQESSALAMHQAFQLSMENHEETLQSFLHHAGSSDDGTTESGSETSGLDDSEADIEDDDAPWP